jgi:hypothetical protein
LIVINLYKLGIWLILIQEYDADVFGDFFFCERDSKAVPKSMMCIYAVDANGYMTGCRSGDHLQNCGNESSYQIISIHILLFLNMLKNK